MEAVETAEAGKNSKNSKSKYLENLARVPYIWYPITFKKKFVSMSTLLNSSSKINAIYPNFTKELGLPIRPTDVGV